MLFARPPHEMAYIAECDRLYGLWLAADESLESIKTGETSVQLLAHAQQIRGELQALHIAFDAAVAQHSLSAA